MNLCNVEHDVSLTALVAGTVKINLTSLNTSDTNNFWDAFNDEVIVMVSFILTCFSSTVWVKVFRWISNLNLCRSLLKNDICWSSWPKSFHTTLLKAVFLLFEEFQLDLFAEIYYEYSWQLFQLLDKKVMSVFLNFRHKFYMSFHFLIITQNSSCCR